MSTEQRVRLGAIIVLGTPAPMGSKKGFLHKSSGRVIITDDNSKRRKTWASIVKATTKIQWMKSVIPKGIAVSLQLRFKFIRPKSHLTTKGMLTKNAPTAMTVKPDLDKLIRCVKDCLTDVVYVDDSQVVETIASKSYGSEDGVYITVSIIE